MLDCCREVLDTARREPHGMKRRDERLGLEVHDVHKERDDDAEQDVDVVRGVCLSICQHLAQNALAQHDHDQQTPTLRLHTCMDSVERCDNKRFHFKNSDSFHQSSSCRIPCVLHLQEPQLYGRFEWLS